MSVLKLPQGAVLAPRQPGIYIELLCVHGNSDAVTAEKAFFEHSDSDLRKVQMLLDAFEHLGYAVGVKPESCTEDICAYVAKKTGHPYEELLPLLMPLLRTDVKCDTLMARPTSYVLCDVGEGGIEHRACISCN